MERSEILQRMGSDNADALRRTWEQAASDLGIEVETDPGVIVAPEVVAIVRGFGRPCGTAIVASHASAEARREAEERGFCVSVLAESYEEYERERFVDTLNDWGWFGPGEPPDWYTGQPWS